MTKSKLFCLIACAFAIAAITAMIVGRKEEFLVFGTLALGFGTASFALSPRKEKNKDSVSFERAYCSWNEAAEYLGIPYEQFHELVMDGEIRAFRYQGQMLVKWTHVRALSAKLRL